MQGEYSGSFATEKAALDFVLNFKSLYVPRHRLRIGLVKLPDARFFFFSAGTTLVKIRSKGSDKL
jgi:hypothetical protein